MCYEIYYSIIFYMLPCEMNFLKVYSYGYTLVSLLYYNEPERIKPNHMTTETSSASSSSGWVRMRFKKNKVWVATDSDGTILVRNGKAVIRYQLDQNYEYQVHQYHLSPLDDSQTVSISETTGHDHPKKTACPQSDIPVEDDENCIYIYADGASSGNPGPSGIGVVLRYRNHEKEISRNIGVGTNNIAELEAIRTGLLEVKNPDLKVKVYTDSSYAYGLLALGWKAKKNTELVSSILNQMKRFKNLQLIKVKGHAGIAGNEKADRLASSAAQKP